MAELISRRRDRRKRRMSAARSRPPTDLVPFFAMLTVFLVAVLLLHGLRPRFHDALTVGQKSPVTIVAAMDFECTDLSKTELERRRQSEMVPPVFSVSTAPLDEARRDMDKLFDRLRSLRTEGGDASPSVKEVGSILDLLGIPLKPEEALQIMPDAQSSAIGDALKLVLSRTWDLGIVSQNDKTSGLRGIAHSGRVMIDHGDGRPARLVEVTDLLTPALAAEHAVALAAAAPALAAIPPEIPRALLGTRFVPNLLYEHNLTNQRRQEAADRTPRVTMTVRTGATLVEAGEAATAQTVETLRAHALRMHARVSPVDVLLLQSGQAGLLLLALAAALLGYALVAPDFFHERRLAILFATLTAATLVATRGLLHVTGDQPAAPVVPFLLPLGFAPLTAVLLVGAPFALIVGLWTAVATSVMCGNSSEVLALGIAATFAAAWSGRNVRRRARVFEAGLWIGAAEAACVLCLGVMLQQPGRILGTQAGFALVGGLAAALAALLATPLLEMLLGFTTDIRLLEFTDLSHPLLQRLAMEAPGTYPHSLVVANLAQAAAAEIGAHPLLVRVGAYFHDIGKLSKPDYFIENSQSERNPHDDLSPNMSALVILSHVKEGQALARQYRLPAPVVEAIRQHHGTSLIRYFYHRAVKQADGLLLRPAVEEQDFRYPGPRPHSREMAILALADAVEAASRAMKKTAPARMEALINEIVSRKLADGQLSNSGLTLAELERVKKSFLFTLVGMMHARVEYPSDEPRSRQPPAPPAGPAPGREGPDRLADETPGILERAEEMG